MQLHSRLVLSAAVISACFLFFGTRSAVSGQNGSLIRLQATTPGSPQTGHMNISGTGIVGGLKMATGAANGSYLRSDASGNASWAAFPSALPPSGTAGGDLAGSYPNPTLASLASSLNKVSGGAMTTNGSFVGIGTSTPVGSANFVVSQATTGYGGMYVNTSASGQPFYGYSQGGSIAAYHFVDGTDSNKWKLVTGGGERVVITTTGNVGLSTTPSLAKLHAVSSTGEVGVRGVSGVATGDFVNATGVWGETSYNSGAGVQGITSGSQATGVYGLARGTSSKGVIGSTFGTDIASVGVLGIAFGTTAYAGYFDGRLHVNGNLSKGGGSFKIDHPLDPANKYLYHSFVESPDMMNIYNGTVRTDDRGFATVTMPDWFEALNRDFRYQLTIVDESEGAWTMARVVRKMKGNRFTLQTSEPNVEVSWQVTGIRHDNYANANRIPVEEEKEKDNRGLYLFPKEAGQPDELGISYQLRLDRQVRKK